MSLRTAVQVILENVEKREDLEQNIKSDLVSQLKMALIASTDEKIVTNQVDLKSVSESKKTNDSLDDLESMIGETQIRLVELINPELNTYTMTAVDPKMPVGAKTMVDGYVYILQMNGTLLYSKEETDRYKEMKQKK